MCSPSCSSQLLSVLHSIWGGTWQKQTNGYFLPRLSTPLIMSFFLKRWDGAASRQLIDWFPNYPDHRELWLTAQPQSVYWSLPVYPRAVMLAHFSWRNSSMTFLILPSIKRAPPHMSMIPKCTTYFKNEGLWYSRAGSDKFEHPELWNKYEV